MEGRTAKRERAQLEDDQAFCVPRSITGKSARFSLFSFSGLHQPLMHFGNTIARALVDGDRLSTCSTLPAPGCLP